MISWHRLFGVTLTEYFAGTGWQVEVEVDLSVRQQLLDIVIVRRGEGTRTVPWPDGFEHPADHNLLTFKSLREPLDCWALQEFLGHYVNYRKQQSPAREELLPESHFALFAATMRFPRDLAQEVAFQEREPGVYDIQCLGRNIRVLVMSQVAQAERNALWNLFSGSRERVIQAARQLQPRLQEVSTILNDLFLQYNTEGIAMPFNVEEYLREAKERQLREMPLESRLAGLSLQQRLTGLSPEQIVNQIPLAELLAHLTPEQLSEVEAYLKQRGLDADRN
jgi:hypothetical protein